MSTPTLQDTNEWDKLAGWEVTCEGCGHEFLLGGVEY
jgi:hypothetical protein